MASIEQIIKQSVNPFDNFAAGNFWQEKQSHALTVESIHQKALAEIKDTLNQVVQDRKPRTLILYGDSGVGKTHFLGRLKKTLNPQAFFAYIEPFPQSDYIWRHILRYTVDSLVKSPDDQEDSQLLLWLKSCLSEIIKGLATEQKKLIEKVQFYQENIHNIDERKKFIEILRKKFNLAGIYNANEFFSVLYNLTNPKLYSLACEWLKGDSLDEDDLHKLGVGRSIDTENAARQLLANFSKLSAKTKPIVLCFDQLDNIARLPDKSIDLPALFNVNSTIHNENWKGILVIISIITSTWNHNYKRVPPADLARTNSRIPLKNITLAEAKKIWQTRLYPLHSQAQPQPQSNIYPLTEEALQKEFPGGKALPRHVLKLGKHLIQEYKHESIPLTPPSDNAAFKLVWLDEFNKVEQRVTRIKQFSSNELIRMLQEALSALQVGGIKPKFLPSPTFAACSLSYEMPESQERVGVTWVEEPNLKSFYFVMKACHQIVQKKACQRLYLIRAEGVGKSDSIGHRIYMEIFTDTSHHHIRSDLVSVQYLVTYHNLVNAACARELVVGDKLPDLKELESLVYQSKVLEECPLFKKLGIFTDTGNNGKTHPLKKLESVTDFLLNLVAREGLMGRNTLIENGKRQFGQLNQAEVEQSIQQLCESKKIQVLDPNAKPEEQLICFVPK